LRGKLAETVEHLNKRVDKELEINKILEAFRKHDPCYGGHDLKPLPNEKNMFGHLYCARCGAMTHGKALP
jgi:hypothetical protein